MAQQNLSVLTHGEIFPEPLPIREPGATFRKPAATIAAPRPVPAGSPR